MNRKISLITILFVTSFSASAQTLFTYGGQAVDAKEFIQAYNKNNTQVASNKTKAMRDYLTLYINSRLRIREAYERRYDTLSQIITEVDNLRAQISENYMNDPATVTRLKKEAFDRSQKDVHAAHIFISFKNELGLPDTVAAATKKDQVLQRLQKGEDFMTVAQQLSDDPSAKTTRGDLGFITLLTVPYEFETAIYNTAVGKYSGVVRSRNGYHIFKNIEERKAVGSIRAQQILLAIPPGSDDAAKKKIAKLADSLYKRIMAGDNFNHLAATYSNDYVTAVNGGLIPDITVGRFDPVFEKMLWSLPKDNAVSKPFMTEHGWHILKRVSRKPVVTNPADKTYQQELLSKIMADKRWNSSRDFIYGKVMTSGKFRKYDFDENALRAMSDSALDHKPMPPAGRSIKPTTPLFSIGDSVYTASTWITYANTYRFKQDGTGAKPYETVREEFLQSSLYEYYKSHLEEFNDEFRQQMKEFRDGNIFFEVMQQEVWNKAQTDTVALMALYEKNKSKYMWAKSADAVIFFCSDITTATKVHDLVKKNPSQWRSITEQNAEKVVADSARYEWSQIPNLAKLTPRAGLITTPLLNTNDNTASFAYIAAAHTQPIQRTFNEARGIVITDYQAILEKEWTENLRKKYPVVINEKVMAEISK